MALRFRPGTRGDGPEIVALLNASFRTPMDTATWEWYVYGNPLGNSQVYVAMGSAAPEIVGVIAFAPIRLRIAGAHVLGDYAHHLALRTEYRDTLSYLGLLRYSLDAQAARGIKLAIGPPNRTAYPIHKKLMKWVDFGYLDVLRKVSPKAQTHACSPIEAFSAEFDEFHGRVAGRLSFCVEKNSEWMNWRFCRRPGSPYTVFTSQEGREMSGYVILKRWQEPDGYRKAHIVDLHALNETAVCGLLAAAESYAADCNELNLWAAQGYPYRAALTGCGFEAGFRQPLIARTYDRSPISYPEGECSLSYGDGDTLY